METTGKIVVLAYPDTFVKMSDEWICKFLPLVGLGTKEYIKAGHAAQVLINSTTGEASYYDFGRYITPKGFGRVRSAFTDVELKIPFKINFSSEGNMQNLNELLLWLDANPDKTHGEGRLIASVCENINFRKAKDYADSLQKRGSIPYGAFTKDGSNCSRFVTETILAGTSEKKIQRALKFNKRFTPSAIGNVEKAGVGAVFEVFNGAIKPFEGSAFKENLKNYFHKRKNDSLVNNSNAKSIEHLHKLEGIGSSAFFEVITNQSLPKNYFRIKRYNNELIQDFDGVYFSEEFNAAESFQFTYDSHCAFCHILQNEQKIKLSVVSSWETFSLRQKKHLI